MNYLRNGFLLAGMANIGGVLIFSKLFTNPVLNEAYPMVMSNFGLLMIIVWGLAYISVANQVEKLPLLSALFSIEKLIYSVTWILWHQNNDLMALYSKDLFAGIFFAIYGLNDFAFMLFFGWTFWKTRKGSVV